MTQEEDIYGLPRAPSWQLFRKMAGTASLSAQGSEASKWALAVLEGYLGASWPRRQFERRGWIPSCLLGYAGGQSELPRLLSLACNVDRLGTAPGSAAVRKLVSNTATASDWRHFCLQLEVARAAAFVGELITFEPTIYGTDRSGDLEVVLAGRPSLVEVTSVSRSDADIRHEGFYHRLHWALVAIADETRVSMDVEIRTAEVPEDQIQTWLATVRDAAALVARTGVIHRDHRGFASITLSPTGHDGSPAPGVTRFVGAVHSRDAWHRIKDALRDKARQTAGASGVWIRVDAVDGLFSLSDWAQRPLRTRIEQIAMNLQLAFADFGHVHGVVISSGAAACMGVPDDPALHQRADAGDAVLLRRCTAPGNARETVVVPLAAAGRPTARAWIDAYSNEAKWLQDDLRQHGWSLTRMRPAQPST